MNLNQYTRARMDICVEDHSSALEASHEPQTVDHRSCWETAPSRANRGARRLSRYFAAGQQQQLSVGPVGRGPDASAPLGACARRARTTTPVVRTAEKLACVSPMASPAALLCIWEQELPLVQ